MSEIDETLSYLMKPGLKKSSMTEAEVKFRDQFNKVFDCTERAEVAAFIEGAKFVLVLAKRFNLQFIFPVSQDLLKEAALAYYPDFDPLPEPVKKRDVGY